jgi:hypothetical protein
MRADDVRTILVVADRPHLPAMVRERVPSQVALTRWAQPDQVTQVWHRCRPWPWVVVGVGAAPEPLTELSTGHPAVMAWMAAPGRLLPSSWVGLSDWNQLSIWLDRLRRPRAGLRLAPYRGVNAEGRVVRAPAVEALIAAHPSGLAYSQSLDGARQQLSRHALPGRIRVREGLVFLEPII